MCFDFEASSLLLSFYFLSGESKRMAVTTVLLLGNALNRLFPLLLFHSQKIFTVRNCSVSFNSTFSIKRTSFVVVHVIGRKSPLKEVSPGRVLNKHILSSAQYPSKQRKSFGKFEKYRLDVPRRDVPLSETVDSLAVNFNKCAKITPPKRIDIDDRVSFRPECVSYRLSHILSIQQLF